MSFNLVTNKKPKGDQKKAIKELVNNLDNGINKQVLLGVTGSGKTFTISNVIEKYNKPTLVLAPNKTLANQLYVELKELFPNNQVEYFISNFDYYRPEAYLPGKDLYIEKSSQSN
jgi:excinuclease ABC subunit B